MSEQDLHDQKTPTPEEQEGAAQGADESAAGAAAAQGRVATEEVPPVTPDAEGPAPAAADDGADGGELVPTPEAYEAQIEELRHNWLRALADFDNLKKRTARDIEAARQRDRGNILRSFLDVLDNLQRALGAAGAEESRWVQGIDAIRRQMLDILRNFGVQPFESKGQPFDARRHEAVATVNLPDQPEGAVVEVVQEGFLLGENTILRPAKVVVVRHG